MKNANFESLRKKLLETALPFYQKLAEQAPGKPEREAARGRAYGRLAGIRQDLGESASALADYRAMHGIFTRLAEAFPAEPDRQSPAPGSQRPYWRSSSHRTARPKSWGTALSLARVRTLFSERIFWGAMFCRGSCSERSSRLAWPASRRPWPLPAACSSAASGGAGGTVATGAGADPVVGPPRVKYQVAPPATARTVAAAAAAYPALRWTAAWMSSAASAHPPLPDQTRGRQ